MKTVIFLTGGNCAGKTTMLHHFQGKYPAAKFLSMDNDNRYKTKGPANITAAIVEDLKDPNFELYIAEGTRTVPCMLKAMAVADPNKKQIQATFILLRSTFDIVKQRIVKRREKKNLKAQSALLNDNYKLMYEGTSVRQRNALDKYGHLYPHTRHEVTVKPDYSEQQEVYGLVEQLCNPPKRMVIQIRGTSGSGKSVCVHNLLDRLPGVKLMREGKIQGYRLNGPHGDIYVVGSYERTCGGCDTIKTQDEVCERVRRYAAKGHVIFEGLLCSLILQRYVDLSAQLPTPMVWAILDTPLKTCLERVEDRRQERGVVVPLNPKNTTLHFDESHSRAERALKEHKQTVIYLDHRRAPEQVYELLTAGTLDGSPLKAGYRYEEGRAIALGEGEINGRQRPQAGTRDSYQLQR